MEFISVTGRRVFLKPVVGEDEKRLLRAIKDDAMKYRATSQLLKDLVVEAEPEISSYDALAIGEEVDLLLCLRMLSLGPLFQFRATCPNGHARDYQVDVREVRRTIQVCDDPNCPCHQLHKRYCNQEERDKDWIEDGVLTADWTEIPVTHLLDNPPEYRWTLPVSQKEVIAKLAPVRDKAKVGRWADEADPGVLSKTLAVMTVSLDGETKRGFIEKGLDQLSSLDRMWFRDKISEVEPGIDTELEMTCQTCGAPFNARLPLSSPFFIPKQAPFPIWFPSVLRCALENGTSARQKSWVGHTRSETSTETATPVMRTTSVPRPE